MCVMLNLNIQWRPPVEMPQEDEALHEEGDGGCHEVNFTGDTWYLGEWG